MEGFYDLLDERVGGMTICRIEQLALFSFEKNHELKIVARRRYRTP